MAPTAGLCTIPTLSHGCWEPDIYKGRTINVEIETGSDSHAA